MELLYISIKSNYSRDKLIMDNYFPAPIYISQWTPGNSDARQNDCGPTCAGMFAAGRRINILINKLPTQDPTGETDAPELVKMLKSLGIDSSIEYSDPSLPLEQAVGPGHILLVNYTTLAPLAQDVKFKGPLAWHWLIYVGPDPNNPNNTLVLDPDYWGSRINEGDHKSYPTKALRAAFIPYPNTKQCKSVYVPGEAVTTPPSGFTPYQVKVTATVLNVRSTPNTVSNANIVSTLKTGDIAIVLEDSNGWHRIGDNKWVSAQYTVNVVQAPPPASSFADVAIDMSHYNNISNETLFLEQINSGRIVAIFHKAWEYHADDKYKDRQAKYGKLCYFIPICYGVGDIDPVKQADDFLAFANPQNVAVVLDKEGNPDGPAMTDAQAEIWMSHVQSVTGKPPILYTSLDKWRDSGTGPKTTPLWISSDQNPPTLPPQWSTWSIQQHAQSTVPGIDGVVDRDQFNGTSDQFKLFLDSLAGSVASAPVTARKYVTEDGLRIRPTNSTALPQIGSLNKGDLITVILPSVQGGNLMWLKLSGQNGWVAEMYTSDTNPVPPVTPPGTTGLARPGMHIVGSAINNQLRDKLINSVKSCHDAGKPYGAVVVCDDPGMAEIMSQWTTVVYRHVGLGDQYSLSKCQTPEAARVHAQFIYGIHKADMNAAPHVQFFQFHNEDGVSADFEMETMRLAELDGRHVGLFAYAVGNPDTLQEWTKLAPVLKHAMANGHAAVLHEYGAFVNGRVSDQYVSAPAGFEWFGGRHRMNYNSVPADCRPILIIGETGPSSATYHSGEALVEDQRSYLAELRKDPYVAGQCPFTFGPSWQNAAWELSAYIDKYEAFCKSV